MRITLWHAGVLWLVALFLGESVAVGQPGGDLLLRAESLMLLPKSQPMLYVQVANVGQDPVRAEVSVRHPDSWRVARSSQRVELAAGQSQRLGFSVAEGDEVSTNTYPIEIVARSSRGTVTRRQDISVASAPYFKPQIDGDVTDWKDAIPVSFTHRGKRTVIATYWNRRQFSLLVSVQETAWISRTKDRCFDAVQVVLAPTGTVTGRSADALAGRFEFLIFGDQQGMGHVCQLAKPGMLLADTAEPRPLDSLVCEDAEVAIRREGDTTHYECSLPMAEMRRVIKPSEGREFYFSVLVHDPDETGLRQWGEAAGLWPTQRNRLAWSNWDGAAWGEVPPLDCRTEWGMCSSRY